MDIGRRNAHLVQKKSGTVYVIVIDVRYFLLSCISISPYQFGDYYEAMFTRLCSSNFDQFSAGVYNQISRDVKISMQLQFYLKNLSVDHFESLPTSSQTVN